MVADVVLTDVNDPRLDVLLADRVLRLVIPALVGVLVLLSRLVFLDDGEELGSNSDELFDISEA